MYKINFTFLQNGSASNTESLKVLEKVANNKYKEILQHSMHFPNKSEISGCLACGVDCLPEMPIDNRRIVEIDCKGLLGTNFCEVSDSVKDFPEIGQKVIIKHEDFYDIGIVKENSDLIKVKRAELGLFGEELPQIIRFANDDDIVKYNKNLLDEVNAKPFFLKQVEKHNLNMKLVGIHYQYDRKRLFFFYTSDGRVDFRELAKDLASQFKTRIELRQIGVRDEAKNVGGLGTCGREFCCKSFLNNFKRISTQYASDQNLNANLSKLSGPCGKLKCCLSFEIEEN